MRDRVRVADVIEGVPLEDDQVGELARLDRAEVLIETDRLGSQDGSHAQRVVLVHAAGLYRPELPVVTEPLQLAVAADTDPTSGLDELPQPLGVSWEHVLIVAEPPRSATTLPIELPVGREVLQLGVVVRILARVVEVLRPRPAIGNEQGGRVGDPGPLEKIHDVREDGRDGQRMLLARIPVERRRDVVLEHQPALDGRHDALFAGRHDHPLALLTIARHVHLDGLGVVVLAVSPHDVASVVQIADGILDVVTEDPWAGRVDTRPDHGAGGHHVAVAENVGSRRLRIARGRDPIGQIRQVDPGLSLVESEGRPHMRVRVDEAGYDRLARYVDDVSPLRYGDRAAPPDRFDAIVADDDFGVLDDLTPVHRDRARAPQYQHTLRDVPGGLDNDASLRRAVPGIVVVLIIFILVVVFFFVLSRSLRGLYRIGIRLRRIQVVDEVRVSYRIVDAASIGAPARKVSPDVGQLLDGESRVVRLSDRDLRRIASELGNGHDVEVVIHLG